MFYLICCLFALVTLVYWLSWRWRNRRMLELASKLPGPPALPIIGNTFLFMASPEKLLKKLSSTQVYGSYFRLWLGPELIVCVNDPSDIRHLLTSNKVSEKGPLYRFLQPTIGTGILTGGPTWRHHRKIATPAYGKKCVQHFTQVFNKEALLLAQTLSSKDPEVTFDVFKDVLDMTTQSTCQTLMGLSKQESNELPRLREVMFETQNIYTLVFLKMMRWYYQIPLIYSLKGLQKKEDYIRKCIEELTAAIVEKRKKALAERNVTRISESEENTMGVVDRFIMSGLNEQEIRWETFTLFTTSQEAGAKIASAVLLFLAHLPEWQEKVYNEILDVLGSEDTFVTEADVKKLTYLDAVYKEVLRYLSIAAMIQRTVTDEVSINDGKITLPVGSSLAISIHEVHRNERFWDEPNRVKPERFLPENARNGDPNAFIPFSLGPMDCLGRVFATAMIKIMVVRVLRKVVFEADGSLEELGLHVAISVRFAEGYKLRAKPRTQKKEAPIKWEKELFPK